MLLNMNSYVFIFGYKSKLNIIKREDEMEFVQSNLGGLQWTSAFYRF